MVERIISTYRNNQIEELKHQIEVTEFDTNELDIIIKESIDKNQFYKTNLLLSKATNQELKYYADYAKYNIKMSMFILKNLKKDKKKILDSANNFLIKKYIDSYMKQHFVEVVFDDLDEDGKINVLEFILTENNFNIV